MARRLISHSEVDAFEQCEKKHYYGHELKLTKPHHGDGLNRGNAGHKYLEVWAKAMLEEGYTSEMAQIKALQETAHMPNAVDALQLVIPWVKDIWPTLGWKIIAVEGEYRVTITETLVFPFKFDLLVEIKGEIVVVDHKFLYDLYTQEMIDIFPQPVKYMAGLRSHGIDVKYAIYNMFRTRKTEIDKYKQLETRPNAFRIKTAMQEQVEGMKRIEAKNPIPLRTANKMNCGNCQFAPLCAAELRGENTQLMRDNFYVHNTYGYTDIEE